MEEYDLYSSVLADVMLIASYILMAAALVAVVLSVVKSVKCHSLQSSDSGGVPVAKVSYACIGLVVICLVVTFVTGSSDTMKINGADYDNWFWLKATDMLVNTSIVLFAVAAAGVAYGLSGHIRKLDPRKKDADGKPAQS